MPQRYHSNAYEADQSLWRHATMCEATTILLYSPDTDVYNIGLTMLSLFFKQYILQLNIPRSLEKKYLNLNNLLLAFRNDPDLD